MVNAIDYTAAAGHYPLEHTIDVLASVDVEGSVHYNMRHKNRSDVIDTITIQTNHSQDLAMMRVIRENLNQRRYYNLGFRKCATFVEEVLRAGGQYAPETI